MRGEHSVVVSNRRRLKYEFVVKRNITVVRGDSGTGKTTLYEMIAAHTRSADVGVDIQCDKKCVALVDVDWKNQLRTTKDSIVFIDEGSGFVGSHEFASLIKRTDNYYVIFSRENLYQLPYSITEIYQIKTSGKFHSFEPIYKPEGRFVYGAAPRNKNRIYQTLLTEDPKAGFQFYEEYFKDADILCEGAGSKSKIFSFLLDSSDVRVFVLADGAAFGPESDRLLKLQALRPEKITVCLPESFEWLILESGLIKSEGLDKVLAKPSDYIDSAEFESWEQFFSTYLEKITDGTVFAYKKNTLREPYKLKQNSEKVVALISNGNIC